MFIFYLLEMLKSFQSRLKIFLETLFLDMSFDEIFPYKNLDFYSGGPESSEKLGEPVHTHIALYEFRSPVNS